jgi:hypothetical protein
MANKNGSYRTTKPGFFSKGEWKVFIWCLVTAFFLWYLTALNETYTSYLELRVHYHNVPKNKVFVKPLPTDLRAAVLAKGWDLLAYRLGDKHEDINIDLGDYPRQSFILTRTLKVNIQQQLPQKITLNDIYPDTISLAVAKSMKKKLPIILNNKISFRNQYGLGGDILMEPDSVIVTGPESYVHDMKEVYTEPLQLKDLFESQKTSIKLKKPLRANITYNQNNVNVFIPVYQLTEGSVTIPIETINPEIQGIKLIPSSVKIIFQTSLNLYKTITPDMFEAIADVSNLDTTNQKPIRIQLISQPRNIYNLQINPEYVNFIIVK